ncbi:MAG: M23 family metallopeptidase [Clostridiales bacterium]|nr:M23 family metallopeptidase [Clostridiales bacterium]
MRYYNPQNKNKARKAKESKYDKRHYRDLDFPERPERDKSYRKKKSLVSIPRIITIVAVLVALIIAGSVLIPMTAKAEYSTGYEVFLCGKSVGVVDNPTEVDAHLADMRQLLAEAYNMDVTDQIEIEYKEIQTSAKHICPAEVFTSFIEDNIEVKVIATTIYVNDWPAAVVKTREEADWVLDMALAPYRIEEEGTLFTDINFVEDVRVEEGPADYQSIIDQDTALENLTIGPGVELKWHQVVTGDALARIAKHEGIKVSDIRIANPHLTDSDKIYPGDKLLVVVPKNSLSIRFKQVIDRVQEVPFETEYIKDDTMYTTEKKVLHEGVSGLSRVKAEITFVNGIEVDYHPIEEDVLVDTQTEVIIKGTKSVPKELTLALEGKWPMPLKSGTYRITSRFGPRDTGIAGASKYHNGIDMGAPSGTPIYASKPGTVRTAGTARGYGLYVKIQHDGGVETRYGHCSQLLVKKGEKVKAGQIIALVGNTGISSGSHLHFEIRVDGKPVNPLEGK